MAYYGRFSGDYDKEMSRIKQRRQALIDKARELQPENTDKLLGGNEDGEINHELGWVDVPNPRRSNNEDTITVRPILFLGKGHEDAEREEDHIDRGVWGIGLETRLPTGDTWYIGNVMFSYSGGKLKHEPTISLNTSPLNDMFACSPVKWDSADAELLLALAEDALKAQP